MILRLHLIVDLQIQLGHGGGLDQSIHFIFLIEHLRHLRMFVREELPCVWIVHSTINHHMADMDTAGAELSRHRLCQGSPGHLEMTMSVRREERVTAAPPWRS